MRLEKLDIEGGITLGPEVQVFLHDVRLTSVLEFSGTARLLWQGGGGRISLSHQARASLYELELAGAPALAASDLSRMEVVDCEVRGITEQGRPALRIAGNAAVEIASCSIFGGLACGGRTHLTLVEAQLSSGGGEYDAALRVDGRAAVELRGVKLTGARVGLHFSGDSTVSLDNVVIEGNTYAMAYDNCGPGFTAIKGPYTAPVFPILKRGSGGLTLADNQIDLCLPCTEAHPWPAWLCDHAD